MAINSSKIAREAERRGDWTKAHLSWLAAGNKQNAETCLNIAEAVSKGDKFRERARELGSTQEALRQAQKEIYGR